MANSIKNKILMSAQKVGALTLEHRVVMAPLTRMRSEQPGDIPNNMMAEYYAQRASKGGLIISEATTVAVTGRGYLGAPGIYSDEQVIGWKKIVDAIHAKGGYIFLQLWHVGRVAHTDLTNGAAPVTASAVPFAGKVYTKDGWVNPSPARALETEEIVGIVNQYHDAALRAKQAGFDGIELHSANGYLLDQFLEDGTNKRTDRYGGSVENRARLLFEILDSVITVWESDRVGVRLSPSGEFNAMSDSNPEETFGYVARKLNDYNLAYLHIIEPRVVGSVEVSDGLPAVASTSLRKIYKGTLLSAGGFDPQSAESFLNEGGADLIAFGRFFISNPDLPHRIENDLPLNEYDRDTFYGGNSRGYTDYPKYDEKALSVA